MEVRRNTRTTPTFGRQQFAQAEQTDFRPLLQGAQDLRAGLDAGRRQRQGFELQKRLLEEQNALTQDLEERRRDPNTDPAQLALDADQFYTGRVNAVVEEYRAQGYDPDLVDQFFQGMGRVRTQLSDTALTYQQGALREKAVSGTAQLLDEGSRTVVNDIDSYEEVAAFTEDTIRLNPDLTEEDRERLLQNVRPGLRGAAAESWAMEDPQSLMQQLDPTGRWRKEREAAVTGGAASVVSGTAVGSRQDAIRAAAQKLGVSPMELAGIASYESAGTLDPSVVGGAGGNYEGIFQFGAEERRVYGITKDSSFEEQVDALVRFAEDRGYRPGMGWEKLYTTINAGNPNASVRAADQNGMQSDHYKNIADTHFDKARQFLGINDDLAPGGEAPPQATDVQAIDPGASAATQSDFSTTRDLPPEPVDEASLHPVLRDLTGPERLRFLNIADSNLQKNTAADKAALDILIGNVKSEALTNGEVVSVIPTEEEIIQKLGPVAGPQVFSDMNQTIQLGKSMKTFAVMPPQQMRGEVERLAPTPGSPTFATDNELYQAAQRAEQQVLAQRAADPAAYVLANFPAVAAAVEQGTPAYYAAMDRALETLGFDPSKTSPLSKAMRDQLVDQWPTMPPKARRQFFGDQFKTMGEDRLKALARGAEGTKMEEELRIYALLRNQTGTATIDEVFTGRDILEKDPARRPSREKVTEQFRKSNFKAVLSMAPDASAALQEAAAAIYTARGGQVDPMLDGSAYDKAVSAALGGATPFNDSKGAVEDYTIPPPGVSESRFTTWVEQLQPRELSRMSVEGTPPKYGDLRTDATITDIIEDGVFVMWAPGLYRIRMASDGGYLKTATGNSFLIRLAPKDVK